MKSKKREMELSLENAKQKESSMLIEHTTRNKFLMLKNNMKLLFFLYFCPLAGFLFSLLYHKWLLIASEKGSVWVSLFLVKTETDSFSIQYFRSFLCQKALGSEEKCEILENLRIAGVLALLFMGIAILLHFFAIFQIGLILADKYIEWKPKLCIKLRKLVIITFFLYLVAFFIWFIGSGCFNYEMNELGICFWINAGSVLSFLLLMLYFLYLKRKIREINTISGYIFD